jgi:methionine-rich copper-binding protein CopC
MRSHLRRGLTGVLIAVVLAAMSGGPASAHATYEDSDPADDSTVGSAPSSVWAEFSETLADGSYLKIYDPCGRQVDDGNVQRSLDGYRMTVGMSSLMKGVFTVRFQASSGVDGHVTGGQFTFEVTSGDSCASDSVEDFVTMFEKDTEFPSDD